MNNRKRFIEEYSEGEYLEPKVEKPGWHEGGGGGDGYRLQWEQILCMQSTAVMQKSE